MVKEITEKRVVSWYDIRNLCIEKGFYTHGTNEDYENLANLVTESSQDMSKEVLCQVAEDIYSHSNPKAVDGMDIASLMFLIDSEACHHCFDVHYSPAIRKEKSENMEEAMKDYIIARYPEAVLDNYINSEWGIEYQFYPNKEAEECYTCIIQNGALTILTDF